MHGVNNIAPLLFLCSSLRSHREPSVATVPSLMTALLLIILHYRREESGTNDACSAHLPEAASDTIQSTRFLS